MKKTETEINTEADRKKQVARKASALALTAGALALSSSPAFAGSSGADVTVTKEVSAW